LEWVATPLTSAWVGIKGNLAIQNLITRFVLGFPAEERRNKINLKLPEAIKEINSVDARNLNFKM